MSRRLERMPDGTFVSVPADVTPERLSQIKAKYPAKPQTRSERKAQGLPRSDNGINVRKTPVQADTSRQASKWEQARQASPLRRLVDATSIDPAQMFSAGGSFNFDDEIQGVAGGLARAARGLFTGKEEDTFSRGYQVAKGMREKEKDDYRAENPGTALALEAAGGLALPFSGSGQTLMRGANALRGAGATKAARTVGRAAARMRSSGPVTRAATVGAGMGALNAAGEAESLSTMPSNMAEGAAIGGAFGGALGGAVRAGSAVVRTLRDRGQIGEPLKEAAKARAYQRVGSLIDNIRDANDKPIGTQGVLSTIDEANKTGADSRVIDQSPGLRAEGIFLSRETNLPNSNRLQEMAEQRIEDRRANFGSQTSSRASTGGVDVRGLRESIDGARRAQGDADYRSGGIMDQPVEWDAKIQNFFEGAGPTTREATKRAFNIMRDERRNPLEFGFNENGELERLPRFRTLDYLKRGYGDLIESAIGKGNRAEAARISDEFNKLKEILIEQNPEYAKVLASQRDAFQRLRATELGEEVFKKMNNSPREMLRELNKLSDDVKDDARIGIIDKLLNLDTKADPVLAVRSIMRNKAQRKILEFAFGGKSQVDSFEKYINAEAEAILSDRMVSAGRNSVTSVAKQAGDADRNELLELAGRTSQGFFFGGIGGALANLTNTTRQIAGRINPQTQNEVARILMSKGEDLEEGLRAAAKFFAARTARDITRTTRAARAIATPLGASIGDD